MTQPPLQPLPSCWSVYMVRCCDNTLYTGVTTDITRRLVEHNRDQGGARYTRGRRPVALVYLEAAASRGKALSRERQIKQLSRAAKELLIATAASADSSATPKR